MPVILLVNPFVQPYTGLALALLIVCLFRRGKDLPRVFLPHLRV